MLHSLAARLNRLNDVNAIGEAITAELRTLIDYHNCRIYLLDADGWTLVPIVFRGDLTEYQGETYEELVTRVGEGITGHVAQTGESFYTPDAEQVPFAVQIPGTGDILESILAVPLRSGDRVTGVIVLSNLGYDQFDEEDMRLLEVLASHAAVALENASLFQMEREAAETSAALLALSQALTRVHDTDAVLREALDRVPGMIPCAVAAAYLRDPETGGFRLERFAAADPGWEPASDIATVVDPETVAQFFLSVDAPFVLSRELVAQVPAENRMFGDDREALVAPLRWEPDSLGAVVIIATGPEASFSDGDVRLARGIADIASLALGNARRFHELERFHELVDGLEAVFWEADAEDLQLSFLSRRAARVLGRPADEWLAEPRSWGDHVFPEDRAAALASVRAAVGEGRDRSFEYRSAHPSDGSLWIRDLVHLVRDPHGHVRQIRGLMVDITERKRAEQTLRRSERKYSEAFRREREATQRLRALDEMKNTVLAAVSHDLRTPLTSILGSALTLEQAKGSITPEDANDLVGRIASNARKLERLLSDLLDLDRLQRGIITPQRRPTDVGALVRQVVRESDGLAGREVEIHTDPVIVAVDAAKVERIVENLLSNATRHTPPGTHMWIRAEAQEDGVLIVVEDDGPGVKTEMREAVFEPFRQGSAASMHAPGVGVGLSLVARFAELHGGRAWVQAREGGGASFRVLLPGA
jgi:PAS domain S-box-containing protein